MDTYYKECFVESVYHYKALENWQKFQIGVSGSAFIPCIIQKKQ